MKDTILCMFLPMRINYMYILIFQKTRLRTVCFLLQKFYEICKFIHKTLFNSIISYDTIRKAILVFCFVIRCACSFQIKVALFYFKAAYMQIADQ